MAQFRYTLEPLLKLRRIEEDRAKVGFLSAVRAYRLKEAEIAEVTRLREAAKERHRQAAPGALDIEEILRARRYLNVLYQRISEKTAELRAMRPPLDEARAVYRNASKRRRAVEKLRERRWEEFRREEERKEARQLDELGQMAFLRSRADQADLAGGDAPPRAGEEHAEL